MSADYKYDVAFSFLAQDEQLASQLNDHLQDRAKTFLYSKRQERLAGTDGEETFNSVCGEHARVVVVLYREGCQGTVRITAAKVTWPQKSSRDRTVKGILWPLLEAWAARCGTRHHHALSANGRLVVYRMLALKFAASGGSR